MDASASPSMASDEDSRPIFYYLKNKKNQRVVTICIMKYKKFFSRGISICSIMDQFDKVTGRLYAFKRARIGTLILQNFEKPLTERQIKRNRVKKQFVNTNPICRNEAMFVICNLNGIDKENDDTLELKLPSLFKISTFDETGLHQFEKELLSKIKR